MFIFQEVSFPFQSVLAAPKGLLISSIEEFRKISSQNAGRDAKTVDALGMVRENARKSSPGLYKPEGQCVQFDSKSAYSMGEGALALRMYNDLAGNKVYAGFVERKYAELDRAGKLGKEGAKPSLSEFEKRFIIQTVSIVIQEKRNWSETSEAKGANALEVDRNANVRLCISADVMACLSFDLFGEFKDARAALRKLGSGRNGQESAFDSFFGTGSCKAMENILDALYNKWFGKADEENAKRLSSAREGANSGFLAVVEQDSAAQVDRENRGKNEFR